MNKRPDAPTNDHGEPRKRKKVVLRPIDNSPAEGREAVSPSHPQDQAPPSPSGGTPGSPPVPDKQDLSAPLPPVIIDRPAPVPPTGSLTSQRRAALVVTVVGGAASSFAPLLPWWRYTLRVAGAPDAPVLSATPGTQTIFGLVAVAGGVGALIAVAALVSTTASRHTERVLAAVVVGTGTLAGGGPLLALLIGHGDPPPEPFGVAPQIGLWLSLLGGMTIVAGGFLLRRWGRRTARPSRA